MPFTSMPKREARYCVGQHLFHTFKDCVLTNETPVNDCLIDSHHRPLFYSQDPEKAIALFENIRAIHPDLFVSEAYSEFVISVSRSILKVLSQVPIPLSLLHLLTPTPSPVVSTPIIGI